MNDGVIHLRRAGAAERVAADFRAVVDGARFANTPVPEKLARIVAGVASGPNRDMPLLELCHLVRAVDAGGFTGSEGRWLFFLALERVTPGTVRGHLQDRLSATGWSRDGFELTDAGVRIDYPDGSFEVRFSRMTVLMALLEFLVTMDEGQYFGALDDTLAYLVEAPSNMRVVADASNAIARRFRDYRHSAIDWARHEEKFDRIAGFLNEHGEKGRWRIDDGSIFTFWTLHWNGKGFKEYKSVFEAFVDLLGVLRSGLLATAADDAARLGTDRDVGEVEYAEDAVDGDYGEWENPLTVFDDEMVKSIRFFKKSSERAPLENLMRYGPEAVRLARAFMRLEVFAPVQAGITNDLQIGRGEASVRSRITCNDAEPYPDRQAEFDRLSEHVQALQLATLHAVSSGSLPDGVSDAAKRAFEGMRRQGFDESKFDDVAREAFETAASALVRVDGQLKAMRATLSRMDNSDTPLALLFERDVNDFSGQFSTIYGDVS
jgi:hypothetical protein